MSAIAKDASVTLITAVPGSGKTLRLVWYIKEALAAGDQVFVCNINGLSTDGPWAGWVPFDDPTKWEELPAGAILIVDEAQQFFRAKPGPLPDYIAAMETIRHRGIRLILVTQHPALIHANIRALIGRHEHMVRENGKESSVVYRRNSVIDNVRSDSALGKEDYSQWSFPKDCYAGYKSAEIHTVKRVFTSRAKRAVLLVLAASLMIGYAVYRNSSRMSADMAQAEADKQAQASAGASDSGARERPAIRTAEDYAREFTPVIPSMPWTMPATMDREVLVQPRVFCMSSEMFCRCLTEQGTRYRMPDNECRDLAANGPSYNPFSDPSNTWKGKPMEQGVIASPRPQDVSQRERSGALREESASSAGLPYGAHADYGGIGIAPKG